MLKNLPRILRRKPGSVPLKEQSDFVLRNLLIAFFSIGHCEEALLVINPEIYTFTSSHTKWDHIQYKNLIHQTVMCCCARPCSILEKQLLRQNNVSVVSVVSISRKMEKTLQPQSLVWRFQMQMVNVECIMLSSVQLFPFNQFSVSSSKNEFKNCSGHIPDFVF